MEEAANNNGGEMTLVVRKPCFGLPTACPACLPVYLYLRFAQLPFRVALNNNFPDSDQIPYVEYGDYVAYNNEKGGVVERLKEEGIVDLDSQVCSMPEWLSTKAMISSWLDDAIKYELWVGTDGSSAQEIYYSGLPLPLGKVLFLKQITAVKEQLGITKDNAEHKEEEIYRRAKSAYTVLSTMLGEQKFIFENRLSSLDSMFLGHALLTLHALPEISLLRRKFLEYDNLVRYAENLKTEFVEAASSAVPQSPSDPSSSAPKRGSSNWSSRPKSKPKPKPKREKTEEEKSLKRRAKYFLVTQLVGVLVFLSLMSYSGDVDVDLDDESEGVYYND